MKLDVISEQPWYGDGLQFTCTQCGNCCTGGPGFVWISDVEVERLSKFLKLTPRQTIERYCRKVGGRLSLNESRNSRGEYDCVFLHEEKAPRTIASNPQRNAQNPAQREPQAVTQSEPQAGAQRAVQEDAPRDATHEVHHDAQVLHARRSCTIYPVRPLQCRTWPFWDGNLAEPAAWQRSSNRCPGMGRGQHFTLEQIESRRTAPDWPPESPPPLPTNAHEKKPPKPR